MRSTKTDYSTHYSRWHPDTPDHVALMRRLLISMLTPLLPAIRAGRVLDVGCGFGYALLAMKDLGYSDVEGVETNIEQAQRAKDHGLRVSVTEDTIKWLAPPQGPVYSVVLLLDVLEHLPHDQQIPLMTAIRKSLKPDGRVIIKTPNANSIVASRWRYIDHTHYTSFTEHSLQYVLLSSGFEHIWFETTHVARPSLRLWQKSTRETFVPKLRKYLVRWFWLQVLKAEIVDDTSTIPLGLNLVVVAQTSKR